MNEELNIRRLKILNSLEEWKLDKAIKLQTEIFLSFNKGCYEYEKALNSLNFYITKSHLDPILTKAIFQKLILTFDFNNIDQYFNEMTFLWASTISSSETKKILIQSNFINFGLNLMKKLIELINSSNRVEYVIVEISLLKALSNLIFWSPGFCQNILSYDTFSITFIMNSLLSQAQKQNDFIAEQILMGCVVYCSSAAKWPLLKSEGENIYSFFKNLLNGIHTNDLIIEILYGMNNLIVHFPTDKFDLIIYRLLKIEENEDVSRSEYIFSFFTKRLFQIKQIPLNPGNLLSSPDLPEFLLKIAKNPNLFPHQNIASIKFFEALLKFPEIPFFGSIELPFLINLIVSSFASSILSVKEYLLNCLSIIIQQFIDSKNDFFNASNNDSLFQQILMIFIEILEVPNLVNSSLDLLIKIIQLNHSESLKSFLQEHEIEIILNQIEEDTIDQTLIKKINELKILLFTKII